jgi:dethiobiotin synthetase
MADIALALETPVVLVVGLRLGCLNHALLTQQAIKASGARFAGWIGNTLEPAMPRLTENVAALESFLTQPPLAVVRYQPDAPLVLREAAERLIAGRHE